VALSSQAGMAGERRRRSWTLEQKLAIVKEAQSEPVAVVARRHGMNANHLFIWRQKAREGSLGRDGRRKRSAETPSEPMRFIELGVIGHGAGSDAARIEIVLPSGVVVRAPASAVGDQLASALVAIRAAGL
jgi:transposase-like protein